MSELPTPFERATARRIADLSDRIAAANALIREFTEAGRTREKRGENATAAIFFSCAHRLSDALKPKGGPF